MTSRRELANSAIKNSPALMKCGSIDGMYIQKIIRCNTANYQQVNHCGTDLHMQLDGPRAACYWITRFCIPC